MGTPRKQYTTDFKAKVAVDAIRGYKTGNELAGEYGVHPMQIAQWKKMALEEIPLAFQPRRSRVESHQDSLIASLYQQIGQLKVENDWLKKKSGSLR
jgi:putative transposase